MSLRYPIENHVGKGMIVQMLQDGTLKLNHLLPDELFKRKKTCTNWGQQKIACHLEVLLKKEGVCCPFMLRLQEERDVD